VHASWLHKFERRAKCPHECLTREAPSNVIRNFHCPTTYSNEITSSSDQRGSETPASRYDLSLIDIRLAIGK